MSWVVNHAIQDIGWGKLQMILFFASGLGWFVDNMWITHVANILIPLSREFDLNEESVRLATVAFGAGLTGGAVVWSTLSDRFGRRWPYLSAPLVAGIAGSCIRFANTWAQVCGLIGLTGFGVGGSLPVDSVMFSEFLPFSITHVLVSKLIRHWQWRR